MKRPEIELIDQSYLRIGQEVHEIEIGEPEPMEGGLYDFHHVTFPRSNLGLDGGLFNLPALAFSRSVLIVETVLCRDVVVEGNGWIVATDPKGEVKAVGVNSIIPSVFTYDKDWFLSYVAGHRGMQILGVYDRPFTAGMEIAAEKFGQSIVGNRIIPTSYWSILHQLTH